MLRYKPTKHQPVRIRMPTNIDIRTTMLYNGNKKSKNSRHQQTTQHLTIVS
jgi:hypothetical protein